MAAILKQYWLYLVGAAGVIGALTKFYLDTLNIREAKLKIANLESQLNTDRNRIIHGLTNEEIEKYSSTPLVFKKWSKSIQKSPGIAITIVCIIIIPVLFNVVSEVSINSDVSYETKLEEIFKLEPIKREISWGPHWRDPLNGIKGRFNIYPTKLRIAKANKEETWYISQEFEITDGILSDHLPSPNPSIIPNPPIPSQTYNFKGLANITAKIKIERNKIHFIEKPKLSYTTGNYLGDGAEQIIDFVYIKEGVGIDSD
ncbi:hypothetical protein DSCW_08420 [Desulfosarcina widdelii]|uniref:Uncharacterized protein n=1 Tax=Desulfosarcina widdelii TaxID=947919 RepID=A0A5K7YYC7_9BACT|nr:hypothetical protein [Desulfosarcina widdelii]BBO73425.1 hypothetical protein DSCW_08420 [Desulfosarcina widdelii]